MTYTAKWICDGKDCAEAVEQEAHPQGWATLIYEQHGPGQTRTAKLHLCRECSMRMQGAIRSEASDRTLENGSGK